MQIVWIFISETPLPVVLLSILPGKELTRKLR